MPPAYRFELAGPEDDAALRAVLRRTFMPGDIALTFQREPNFFAAEQVGNRESQVITVRDIASGAIVGLGCRSFRELFVDGTAVEGGYLSGLRGLPEARRGVLLARGYRFLKELHADQRTPYYVTTIFDDNAYAGELLTSRRAGLPVYQSLGHLHTYMIPLYGRRWWPRPSVHVVRGLSGPSLHAAVASINRFNQLHQFAPNYTPEDLHGITPLLAGFSPDNLYGYCDSADFTATLGVWDQTSFKQSVLAGYSRRYRLARPLCAAGAIFGLTPRLPKPGTPLPYVHGAFLSHASGCLAHLEQVLHAVLRDWSGRGYQYLVVGVHERSLADRLLQRYAVSQKSSTLYLVYWEDMLNAPLPSIQRVPHLEVATL